MFDGLNAGLQPGLIDPAIFNQLSVSSAYRGTRADVENQQTLQSEARFWRRLWSSSKLFRVLCVTMFPELFGGKLGLRDKMIVYFMREIGIPKVIAKFIETNSDEIARALDSVPEQLKGE